MVTTGSIKMFFLSHYFVLASHATLRLIDDSPKIPQFRAEDIRIHIAESDGVFDNMDGGLVCCTLPTVRMRSNQPGRQPHASPIPPIDLNLLGCIVTLLWMPNASMVFGSSKKYHTTDQTGKKCGQITSQQNPAVLARNL
ncbi:MAG: hypothetical protein E4H27_01770 [Anaerolineales bacterium]|nr:MAG: hypothetical protein E4H27_01770 [Anaerolineales bacterium]